MYDRYVRGLVGFKNKNFFKRSASILVLLLLFIAVLIGAAFFVDLKHGPKERVSALEGDAVIDSLNDYIGPSDYLNQINDLLGLEQNNNTLVDKDNSGVYDTKPGEKELITERTRNFKKFKAEGNTYRVAGQLGPIHYKKDPFDSSELYKEIDLTIRETPKESWKYAVENNGYQVHLWDELKEQGSTLNYVAEYRRDDKWLKMAPSSLIYENNKGERQLISTPQAVGSPEINNDNYTITWKSVFGKDIDFRYNINPDHFFKTVIINNKEALPEPTINQDGLKLTVVMNLAWDDQVKTQNDFANNTSPNNLTDDTANLNNPDEELKNPEPFSFKDELDRNVWWFQEPKAWDSSGSHSDPDVSLGEESPANAGSNYFETSWDLLRKDNRIFMNISLPYSDYSLPTTNYPLFIDTDIPEEQTAASTDDGYSYGTIWPGYTTTDLTATTLPVGATTTNFYIVGARFLTIPIPAGATITAATALYLSSSGATGSPTFRLFMDDHDSAATFAATTDTATGNPGYRTRTDAYTDWTVGTWNSGTWYTSPSIVSAVQEVVNRAGWANNNNMAVLMGNSSASLPGADAYRYGTSWDYSTNISGPKFNASYTPAAVTRYWIDADGGNWNDTANWSASSGGAGGATVPVAGDTAIFDNAGSTHNGALTINTAVNVATLTFDTNYSGTITQGANTITATTAMTLAGQSLTAGADITASGTLTIATGKILDLAGHNLTVTSTFTNNGTLKMTGGETTVSITNDTDSGTVEYYGTSGPYTIKNLTYFDLKINGAATTFNQPAAALTINNAFNLAAGVYVQPANQNLTVKGNFTIASSGSTFTKGSGTATLILSGAVANATFTGPASAQNLGVVQIGASPGDVILAADFAADTLTVNAGDVFYTRGYEADIGSGGISLTTGAPGGKIDTTDNGGAGYEGDGTIITDAGAFTINAGALFTKCVQASRRSLVKMDGGVTQAITSASQDMGDFQVSTASTHLDLSDALTVDGLTIDGSTTLDDSGGNYAITISESYANSGTFTAGTSTVTFDATASGKTLSGYLNNVTTTSAFYKVVFNGSGGAWAIQDAMYVTAANAADTFVIGNGTVTLGNGNGDNLQVDGRLTIAATSGQTGILQTYASLTNTESITIQVNKDTATQCAQCVIQVGTTGVDSGQGSFKVRKNGIVKLIPKSTATASDTGIEIEKNGYLEIQGSQDDTGTANGATNETTITDTGKAWGVNVHQNKAVRITKTDSLAFGKIYNITDNDATSLTRANNSSADSTIASTSGSGNTRLVCSASNAMISANDEGIGRYLHDATAPNTGYLKITDSFNNYASCASLDGFTVIAEPDAFSILVNGDTIDISDGVRQNDTFEILDYAHVTSEDGTACTATVDGAGEGYIYAKQDSENLIQYADICNLGRNAAYYYGVSIYNADGPSAGEGLSVNKSKFHSNYHGLYLDDAANNTVSDSVFYSNSSEGFYSNAYSSSNTYTYNESYSNTHYGYHIRRNQNNRIYHNIARNNTSVGIYLWDVRNSVITDNEIYVNGGQGILVSDSSGNSYFSNDIYSITGLGRGIEMERGIITRAIDNRIFNNVNGLLISNTTTMIGNILIDNEIGTLGTNSTADMSVGGAVVHTIFGYNTDFGSSTQVSFSGSAYFISRKNDATAGSTKIWGDYPVQDAIAETPQDELTDKFNYADPLWPDSVTSHLYNTGAGAGTEDTNLNFAFSGAMGGDNTSYMYQVLCNAANCVTTGSSWDVYRNGTLLTNKATTGSTYTDSENDGGSAPNTQFKIDDAGTDYTRGSGYSFIAYKTAADTNTAKTTQMQKDGDSLTIGSGKTMQFDGAGGNLSTLSIATATNAYDIVNNGTLSGGNNTLTVSGSFSGSGTTTFSSGSTFIQKVAGASKTFGASSSANNWTFQDLKFENATAGALTTTTSSTGTGQIIVNGTLTVGNAADSANTTLDNETNDRIIDANGDVSITSKGVLSASSTALFTIAGSYSNSGTLTANSGTITFDAGAVGKTIAGTLTGGSAFNNLTFNNAAGGWSFSNTATIGGNLTITTSETAGNGVNLNNQAIAITGNFQMDVGKLTMGSAAVTAGSSWTVNGGTQTPNTSGVTFTAGATGKTIKSSSQHFNNITFNGVGGGWTLQDAMICNNFTNTAGAPNIADVQVTVNGNLDISGTATFAQDDTGTGYMILAGAGKTIMTYFDVYNSRRLKITGTYTAISQIVIGKTYWSPKGKLIIDGGTLAMGGQTLYFNANLTDAISIINGGDITGTGYWYWYMENNTILPGFTATATGLWSFYSGIVTLGGNVNVPKTITNYLTAGTLNTSTFNLTVTGLTLGNSTANFYINLGSGTHTFSGNIINGDTATGNTLDFGTGSTSVGGNINFTNIAVTPGTGTQTTTVTNTSTITSYNGTSTQHFNNLTVNAATKTVTLADALIANGDFTLTAGTFNASTFNVTCVNMTASGSTTRVLQYGTNNLWTVSGNWDSSGTNQTMTYGTSTVNLTGDGSIDGSPIFYNLSVAYPGKTTTRISSFVYVYGVFTLNGGIYTGNSYTILRGTGTPLVFAAATTIGTMAIYYEQLTASATVNVAGGNYGSAEIDLWAKDNNITFNLAGAIAGTTSIRFEASTGTTGMVFNTQNNAITAGYILFRNGTYSLSTVGPVTFNSGSSTISLTASNGLYIDSNAGSKTLNLETSTWSNAGNWTLANGTGTITQNPGTSTVTFNATTTGKTITSNGQSFNNITFNGVGGGWTLQDAMICNNFTNTAGAPNIADFQVTVNGNLDISGTATFAQNDSGTNYMILAGAGKTIQTTLNIYNPRRLKITGTYTANGNVWVGGYLAVNSYGKLIIDGGTLAMGVYYWYFAPNATDCISIVNGGDITGSGGWNWYIVANTTVSGFTATATGGLSLWSGNGTAVSYTLGGNVSIANKSIGNYFDATLNTSTFNLTATDLRLGAVTNNFYVNLGSGNHTFSGNITNYDTATGNTLDLGSSNVTVGGGIAFTNITVTPGTSTVTMNATTTGKTITSAGNSFNNITFNGVGGGWTLQDAMICNDFVNTAGAPNIADFQVTVNGNLNISGTATFAQNDTGTGYMVLAGTGKTIQTTRDVYNPRRVKITGTYTAAGNVFIGKTSSASYGKLIVDGGTLTNNLNFYFCPYATDSISIINGGNIAGAATWYWYISASATIPGFTATATGSWLLYGIGKTYTLGGHVTVPKTIVNYFSTSLDTATYNLSAVALVLGESANNFYVDLGSGTHTFSAGITNGGTATGNTLNFGTGSTSVGGNINFTNITVTPGTGSQTVTMNATTTGKTITSAGNSFNNITFNGVGGGWTLADALIANGNFTLTAGTFNASTFNVTCVNMTASGSTTRVLQYGTLNLWTVSGNWDSSGTNQTEIYGTSTVDLTGTGSVTTLGAASGANFYNLKCAHDTKTTTQSGLIYVTNLLYVYTGGTLNVTTSWRLTKTSGDPLINTGATFIGTGEIYYKPNTNVILAGYNFGSVSVRYQPVTNSVTITLSSNVTTTGDIWFYDSAAGKIGTLDTAGFNLSGRDFLLVAAGTTGTSSILLKSGSHTITRNLYLGGGAMTGSVIDFGTGSISVGGNIDFTGITVTPGTGTQTVTMNATTTGKTITSAGNSFNNITFNGVGGGWTLQDAMICNDFVNTAGAPNIADVQVTVNGNLDISGTATFAQDDTGTNYMILAGTGKTIRSSIVDIYNPRRLKITGTYTANDVIALGKVYSSTKGKLIIDGGTLAMGIWIFYFYLNSTDAISIVNGGDITGPGAWAWYISENTTVPGFTITASGILRLYRGSAAISYTLGGNVSVPNKTITNYFISTLNTSTYNLTAAGLTLGESTNNFHVNLGSGTHTFSGSITNGDTATGNTLNFGTGSTSVGGNINFTNITVTAGTGTQTVTMNGTAQQNITSNGQSFNNLTIKNTHANGVRPVDTLSVLGNLTVQADGASAVTLDNANNVAIGVTGNLSTTGAGGGAKNIKMGTNTWTVGGNVDFTGGILVASTSTLFMNGALKNLNANSLTLNNLTIDGSITATGNVTIGSILTINNTKSFDASDKTITLSGITGIPFVATGTFTPSASTVIYNGNNGGGSTNVTSTTYNNLTLDNAAETYLAAGDITVSSVLNINAGIFDASNRTITLSGSGTPFVITGTFAENTSTVKYSGLLATNITSDTYYNLTLDQAGTTFTAAGDINVSSVLNINAGTFAGSNRTITLSGSGTPFVVAGAFTEDTSTIKYTGLEATNVNSDTYYNLTLDQAGTTFTAAGDITASNVLNITNGTLNASDKTITLSGSGTPFVITGTFTPSTSTIKYTGALATNVASATYNNLTLDQAGTTFTAAGDITSSGILTINAGTFDASDKTITLSGPGTPFVITGAFTPSTSTVIYSGTAAQSIISSGSSFNNLTSSNNSAAGVTFTDSATVTGTFTDITPSSKLTFKDGATYAFSNINLNGADAGTRIVMVSSNPGTPWLFNIIDLAPSASYVSVSDSNASGGNQIDATTGGLNSGNNLNWLFGVASIIVSPASATLDQGATQQFTAIAYDSSSIPIPGTVFTWSIAASGGTIDNAGLFTAGTTAGTFSNTVKALASGVSGYATVIVNELPPTPVPTPESVGGEVVKKTPIVPTETAPPSEQKKEDITLPDFQFYVVLESGNILLNINDEKNIETVINSNMLVEISADIFAKKVNVITISTYGSTYLMNLLPDKNKYQAIIPMPAVKGDFELRILIVYEDGSLKEIKKTIAVDPQGYIYTLSSNYFGLGKKQEVRISDAKVSLYKLDGGEYKIWDSAGKQPNPSQTNKSGEYSFWVPNGDYYLKVEKAGYKTVKSANFKVENLLVIKNVEIEPKIKPWVWLIVIFSALAIIIYLIARRRKKSKLINEVK